MNREWEQATNITKIHRLKLGPSAGVDVTIIPCAAGGGDDIRCSYQLDFKDGRFVVLFFHDFFRQNEHTTTFFKDIIPFLPYDAGLPKVTINGEEWTVVDLVKNELPFGIYKITMEINHYFNVWDEDLEQYIQEPYNKKLTINVSVLPIFEDKYKSVSE